MSATARANHATAADQADAIDAPLDLLLTSAANGPLGRFAPNGSWTRTAAALARRPGTVARRLADLTNELGEIALGTSRRAPSNRDRRIADSAWTSNPLLRRSVQAHLALSETAQHLVHDADLEWRDKERMEFLVENVSNALAPSKNPVLSPLAWKALVDTCGGNVVAGLRNAVSDLSKAPRVPSMVDPDAFEVGSGRAFIDADVLREAGVDLGQYGGDDVNKDTESAALGGVVRHGAGPAAYPESHCRLPLGWIRPPVQDASGGASHPRPGEGGPPAPLDPRLGSRHASRASKVNAPKVPAAMRPYVDQILAVTDEVCEQHLDSEYADLCRHIVGRLARRRPSPIVRGDLRIWAAGVVYAVGQVNFLFDPSQRPHTTAEQLSTWLEVKKTTMANKAAMVREVLKLSQHDTEIMRRGLVDASPLTWLLQVNGMLVDARHLPPHLQQEAFERRLIPYVPEQADQP